MRRERHGTLFADNQRRLDMYLKSLWNEKQQLVPYSTGFATDFAALPKPLPYFDAMGMRIPDVLNDSESDVSGLDCYRATLAHMAAHRRSGLKEMAALAVSFIARTRRQSDQSPNMYFTDTDIAYREEQKLVDDETNALPPRHYPEWDYRPKNYPPRLGDNAIFLAAIGSQSIIPNETPSMRNSDTLN